MDDENTSSLYMSLCSVIRFLRITYDYEDKTCKYPILNPAFYDRWCMRCHIVWFSGNRLYRGGDYDDEMLVSLVEETGVLGGNH